MHIARCRLTLHDTLFYATREMGTLYETERYIHNYALSYALFNDTIIQVPYFCASYKPNYSDDLRKLNEAGIYVTPARPLVWDYVLATWKMAQVTYYRKPERFGGRNYPVNIGRAKELGPGSTFEFFVLSQEPVPFPRWVRLGKWISKAEVTIVSAQIGKAYSVDRPFIAACPLNPLDIPFQATTFDLIAIPPVSLINNAQLVGTYYEIDGIKLPTEMKYNFPEGR